MTWTYEDFKEKKQSLLSNSTTDNVDYFDFPFADFLDELTIAVFTILSNDDFQKKYNYKVEGLIVDAVEHLDDDFKLIDYCVYIDFLDDKFYNKYNKKNENSCAFFSFVESFKQINFENNVVYFAFEVTSCSADYDQHTRDYIALSIDITRALSKKLY